MALRDILRPRPQRTRTITAAGKRINLEDRDEVARLRKLEQPWQQEAWLYMDEIGEIKEAENLRGDALAQCRIFVAAQPDPAESPVDVLELDQGERPTGWQAAVEALDRLRETAAEGLPGLLRESTINFDVPGEWYLIGQQIGTDEEVWDVRSTDEVEVRNPEEVQIEDEDGKKTTLSTANGDYFARIWRRHPRRSVLADSNMRGVLRDCRKLLLLSQLEEATFKSRLTAGFFKVPEELSFGSIDPTRSTGDGEAEDDPFLADFMTAVLEPVENDASAAAVSPMFVMGPAEFLSSDVFGYVPIERPLLDDAEVKIEAILRRILSGMNIPVEKVQGFEDVNHWCVDEATEIMTTAGWRRHDQVGIGDTVLTLNHETGLSEWQPILDMYRAEVEDERMTSIEMRSHSSLTTPHHRWPVLRRSGDARIWATSSELNSNHRLITGAPSADLPQEPKYNDALVELVAWFWTEGAVNYRKGRRHPRVAIYQSHEVNAHNVARIRSALTALYGPGHDGPMPSSRRGPLDDVPRWREVREPKGTTCFSLNIAAARPVIEIAPRRVVSLDFIRSLTRSQLELFITTSLRADGSQTRLDPTATRYITQKDGERLDAIELAAILSGYPTRRSEAVHEGFHRHTLQHLAIKAVPIMQPRAKHFRVERYTGTIWCPVTPNHSWLARRNGQSFYTGNTGWLVESAFQAAARPTLILTCNGLASAYLRPQIISAGAVDEREANALMLWFDATDILVKPNRTKDMTEGYDRIEISGAAYREAIGATEEDAPDEEERARRLAELAIVKGRPAPAPMPEGETVPDTEPEGTEGADETPGPAVTAAASRTLDRLSNRLSSIDRTLLNRLLVASDAAMSEALRRAGNRLRSAVQGSVATAKLVKGVDATEVGHTLGPSLVAQLGVESEALFADAFSDLEARFMTGVERAQAEALDAIESAGGEFDREREERQNEDRRNDAWATLFAALVALAHQRMFTPDVTVPDDGEFDETLAVAPGIIREALQVAGGGVSTSGPPGMVGTGETVLSLIRESLAAELTGWEWEYGDASARSRPFEPHQSLDGVFFTSPDDPVLANAGGWPPVSFYTPGDHLGCLCGVRLALTAPEPVAA